MTDTGSVFIGSLRVFGTDRSGKASVFEDGEQVGQLTEKQVRELIDESESGSSPVSTLTASIELDTTEFQEDVQEAKEELEGLEQQAERTAEVLEEFGPARAEFYDYEVTD